MLESSKRDFAASNALSETLTAVPFADENIVDADWAAVTNEISVQECIHDQ